MSLDDLEICEEFEREGFEEPEETTAAAYVLEGGRMTALRPEDDTDGGVTDELDS